MRRPRKRELDLLRSLVAGPRAIEEGPVGTCLKKGWCRIVDPQNDAPPVRYALTEEGCFVMTAARSGDPHRQSETADGVDPSTPSAGPNSVPFSPGLPGRTPDRQPPFAVRRSSRTST